MNVVIVGNLKTNGDTIRGISETLTGSGINVRYPTDGLTSSDDASAIDIFERIDWADIVIAVPKNGLTFTQSTSLEISYAKYRKKMVLILYE